MVDRALVNIILGADPEDKEDLLLRAALAITLRGIDEQIMYTQIFDRQHDREDSRAA